MAVKRGYGAMQIPGTMRPTHGEFAHLSASGRIKLSLDALVASRLRPGRMVAVTWDPDREELFLSPGGPDDWLYCGSGVNVNRAFGVGRYPIGRYQVAIRENVVTVQMTRRSMVEERKR